MTKKETGEKMAKKEYKSVFNNGAMEGKSLSEYDQRPISEGTEVSTVDEYVGELRSARQLSDKDLSVLINARG